MATNRARRTYWLSYKNIDILTELKNTDPNNRTRTRILEDLIQEEALRQSSDNLEIDRILNTPPREYNAIHKK